MSTPQSKTEIAARLESLATEMETIGIAMDYYGGMAHWSQHGREMIGTEGIAREWVKEIREEVQ